MFDIELDFDITYEIIDKPHFNHEINWQVNSRIDGLVNNNKIDLYQENTDKRTVTIIG